MKKAVHTNKVLLLVTFLFVLIAAASFAAFREAETVCSGTSGKCNEAKPLRQAGGRMLWDDFSHRFLSFVSSR